ncbi:MAG: hypothetical protein R2764_15735 [Bacteroidales bacterium]
MQLSLLLISLYKTILKPNTWVKDHAEISVYIPTGSSIDNVKTILYENGIVINRISFEWLAKRRTLLTTYIGEIHRPEWNE